MPGAKFNCAEVFAAAFEITNRRNNTGLYDIKIQPALKCFLP